MIQYKSLSSSSIIDLVAPGSPVTVHQVREAVQQVKALNFQARVPSDLSILSTSYRGKTFSSLEFNKNKFEHLKNALIASDSEAVWCIRGGYGSQKLMPFLMKMKKPKKPKIFIGYSDATVLQMFLNLKWKWPVLHFPVLVHIKDCSSASLKRFKNVIQGVQKNQEFSALKLLNEKYTGKRTIHSYLTGGNLTLIQSSIGTPWAGSFQNKILFLEDVGETAYRLDRALWQMLNSGVFRGVKAVVLGDFISSSSKKENSKIRKLFRSFASRVSFPVIEGVPCGHGSKKEVLPFLTSCSLKISSQGKAHLHIASPFHY